METSEVPDTSLVCGDIVEGGEVDITKSSVGGELKVGDGGCEVEDVKVGLELVEADNDEIGVEVDDADGAVFAEDITYLTPDGKRHRLLKDCTGIVSPPTVGMMFGKWEEVESYFRSYAKQQGYGIVRASSAKRQLKGMYIDEKRSYTWRCDRWGSKDTRRRVNGKKVKLHSVGENGVKLAHRKSKKCHCPVLVYSSKDREGEWVIRRVILQHVGHSPTPSRARFVSRYRQDEITPSVKKKLFNDLEVGVRLPLIHRALVRQRDGYENTAFTERDLRNVVAKDRKIRMDMEGGDANAMVNYFTRMNEVSKNFYHAERVDRYSRLKDIFWVDARSRAAYREFNDVVCFDSTYITNEFQLPFAIFVGVNHHGQTTLFGCALLSHEDTETFEWLFTTWLSCMEGVALGGILTDQCMAMRKALAAVMPQTQHRWCLWHILQKFKSKLGSYEQYAEFKPLLHNAIYDSLTPEEFETTWNAVIKEYKLEENEWLEGLYLEREMWVPVHMKHMFWAGMQTTQRSESINSFFDGYVQKHTRLHQFASQYFTAMQSRICAEETADEDSNRNIQELVSEFPIEAEFQRRYTSNKFYEFQVECLKLMYVNQVERRKISEHVHEHVIEDIVWYRCNSSRKDIPSGKRREYLVTFDVQNNDAWCICKHFECRGIMCRHLIRVFGIHSVEKLPEKFILRRWCQDVERQHTKVKINYTVAGKSDEVKRHDLAMNEFEPLCELASKSDENLEYVVQLVRDGIAKLAIVEPDQKESNSGLMVRRTTSVPLTKSVHHL